MDTISVDFGGTFIKIGLIRDGHVADFTDTPSYSGKGLTPRLAVVETIVAELLEKNAMTAGELNGIGIAIPGLVDATEKRVLSTNAKYNDAINFSFTRWVDKTFNVPFIIENDARAALAGEVFHGGAQGSEDAVMMIFGTGIGTAAMINGQLLRGKHHQAGVLGGHFITDHAGYMCTCGNKGCVEAQASNWSLPIVARERAGFNKSRLADADHVDYKSVVENARAGDDFSESFLEDLIEHWAAGLTNLVHAYDPSTVILSGGLMKSKDYLLPKIKARVLERTWTPWGQPEFLAAEKPEHSVLLGLHHLTVTEYRKTKGVL
ncbi:ROK family protein [Salipaludibacillus aurantiacus]|uniref:Glucokinase n=1 Tax=Salipaludibacillus aurantiacus TaxID=1601833 RepID=A0A1H9UQL2_9BACI|nr:ROK family protein [Salipaludibacillus aurantiacus]SES11820.1 glucokinase [Salipaludibacillus aurantiacus]